MKTAIWWIRRDLRLADNQALQKAMQSADEVLPVFILDSVLLGAANLGKKRQAFLFENLRCLHEALVRRGSHLTVRCGDPLQELTKLMRESQAEKIIAEEDTSPYARHRDERTAKRLPLTWVHGLTVHHPDSVRKADGTPFRLFTPFSRTWKALPLPNAHAITHSPKRIQSPPALPSDPIPDRPNLTHEGPFPPGEAEAHQRLTAFTSGDAPPIDRYASDRNRVDLPATSQLSPYLRFGNLSARQAVAAAMRAIEAARGEDQQRGAETWLNELIWREFYIAILYHYPFVRQRSFRRNLDKIPWENDEDSFQAWCAGQTGFPIIDAAMRQLKHSGWMHNRARMVSASFLTKNLLIDWRWGERWFMQQLVDGDPAANNGGWQWIAGTGTDAAPYFRIFNPILQSKRFDPEGDYIRKWVPELHAVSKKFIHEPWRMAHKQQHEANCIIGRDYPMPIVDLRSSRERTLAAYAQARERAGNDVQEDHET